ncbi:MAG TPA: acyl-CoA desaturase, partial [Acidimicrobiia bacterium]
TEMPLAPLAGAPGDTLLEDAAPGDVPFDLTRAAMRAPLYRKALSAVVAVGPIVTAVFVIAGMLGRSVPWLNLLLASVFYVVILHGVTVGFHRLFTHKSFDATRPLKVSLALLGSMSFQGSIIGWVADHRRHHRYADRPGDPHSPLWRGEEPLTGWRGLWHAHGGWFYNSQPTPRAEYAADLIADPDLRLIDKLFVPCCVVTLALPFGIGYAITGTLAGALGAFVWAGVLRIGLAHNVTWSINSICHRFGRRPFRTRDVSTNFAPLALLSGGESWHNAHHAFPTSFRHGLGRFQLDSSAMLIRIFEHLGWATNVRRMSTGQLNARRIGFSPV